MLGAVCEQGCVFTSGFFFKSLQVAVEWPNLWRRKYIMEFIFPDLKWYVPPQRKHKPFLKGQNGWWRGGKLVEINGRKVEGPYLWWMFIVYPMATIYSMHLYGWRQRRIRNLASGNEVGVVAPGKRVACEGRRSMSRLRRVECRGRRKALASSVWLKWGCWMRGFGLFLLCVLNFFFFAQCT